MSSENLRLVAELEEALAELPMFDVHTHLVGGHSRGSRAARHFALPHGRQRSLRGRLPRRGAADAIPRLADAGRSPDERCQGNSVSSDDPQHELLVGAVG